MQFIEEICGSDSRELDPLQTQFLYTGVDFFSSKYQAITIFSFSKAAEKVCRDTGGM